MKRLMLIGVFIAAFSACFNPSQGNEATLTISLLENSRAVTGFNNKVDSSSLDYTITLKNNQSGEVKNAVINAAGTYATAAALAPGSWDILVEAAIYGYPYARGEIPSITITPGPNSASVPMRRLPGAIALNIGASHTFPSVCVNGSPEPEPEIKIWNFSDEDIVEVWVSFELENVFYLDMVQPIKIKQDESSSFFIYLGTDEVGYFQNTLTVWVNDSVNVSINMSLEVNDHTPNLETGLCTKCGALTYEIGGTGPGGGIIFYSNESGFTVYMVDPAQNYTAHYLEAASDDSTGTVDWWTPNWYDARPSVGAYYDAIGYGRQNTDKIKEITIGLTDSYNNPAESRAVDYCLNLNQGGYSDWFLPSINELEALSDSSLIALDPTKNYWSSTEVDDYYAQALSNNRAVINDDKFNRSGYSVRPIRAF